MTSVRKFTIYLAGPISNCNSLQKRKWRDEIKEKLGSKRFDFSDPSRSEPNWNPKDEIVDIDKADVVVANMWRESIGTVVGILQACRRGKPVVVIDPNYLDSTILRTFVGNDRIVHSVDAAVNKMDSEIMQLLTTDMFVKKRGDKGEQRFSFQKFQRSINTACEEAGINDALFPVLVAKGAYANIRSELKGRAIHTEAIREAVFRYVAELSGQTSLYSDRHKEYAQKLKETWRFQEELVKGERRKIEQLESEIHRLNETIKNLENQLKRNGPAVQKRVKEPPPGLAVSADTHRSSLNELLCKRLAGAKILCVSPRGRTAFREPLRRAGFQDAVVNEFFAFEEIPISKNSNLVEYIQSKSGQYGYLLYAWNGLRHLPPDVKQCYSGKIFAARSSGKAVDRFARWLLSSHA